MADTISLLQGVAARLITFKRLEVSVRGFATTAG